MSSPRLASLLAERRLLVVAGTGGVGKTTIAAALAIEAARRRQRVLVLTIDPAHRLYDALNLDRADHEMPGEARPVSAAAAAQFGIVEPGRLDALMLDMKSTFDGLVDRFAESDEAKARILENPIYQHVSNTLAGSTEYAAMEKLCELAEAGRYDLIVLDTPPSQHALDFLDAPRRLVEFLDSRLVRLLVHPAMAAGRFGFRFFQRTGQRVLQSLERISGVGFVRDISDFLRAIEGMSDGFRNRATRVRALLLGDDSAFLLVAAPSPEAADTSLEFLARMQSTGVPVEGVLLNRMRLWPQGEAPASILSETIATADLQALTHALASGRDALPAPIARQAAESAVEQAKRYAWLVELDQRSTSPLREQAERNRQLVRCIPEFPQDACDANGLLRIGDALFRAAPEADPGAATGSNGGQLHAE